MDKYYNVWCIKEKRWTNHRNQDPNHPEKLTLEKAIILANLLNGNHSYFEVRELHADGITSIPLHLSSDQKVATDAIAKELQELPAPSAPAFDFDTYNNGRQFKIRG